MKHVNDEFWQKFGPGDPAATRSRTASRDFFMFGEVALDGSGAAKSFTSHFTTHDKMQAVLDFPFQDAARDFASREPADRPARDVLRQRRLVHRRRLERLPAADVPRQPRHGPDRQLRAAPTTPAPRDAELLARDRLAHELMYFSRGNPVVYYGDEQGFTGAGGDQDARQTMFASQVPRLPRRRPARHRPRPTPQRQLRHRRTRCTRRSGGSPQLTEGTPGAAQRRPAGPLRRPTARASSRSRASTASEQREYVVALNNSETAADRRRPDVRRASGGFAQVYGAGAGAAHDRRATGTLAVTVPALSAVVYASAGRIPRSTAAPAIALAAPAPAAESRGRMQVAADVGGSSFYEVTFQRQGRPRRVAVDRHRRHRAVPGVPRRLRRCRPGTHGAATARSVLDNAGPHRDQPRSATATVPAPTLTIEAPAEGANVRGTVEVRAVADPERATHVVRFERSVAGGAWTPIGTDDSSPGVHGLRRPHAAEPGRRHDRSTTGRCSPSRTARTVDQRGAHRAATRARR